MVKCVVSCCSNRLEVKGLFNRPQKRFFNLPRDPARVKVWLAALRETDKLADCLQDSHIICEDHFLPEHVTPRGISDDAIPLMPPYLDGPLGSMMAAGLHEEEDEGEEEGDEPAAVVEKQQDGGGTEEHQSAATAAATADSRDDVSPKPPDPKTHEKTPASTTELSYLRLTRRLMELLCAAPNGSLDLGTAAVRLQACRRRLNDVTGILAAFRLIRRPAPNQIQWIAESPVTSYLGKSDHAVQEELGHLKVVEETLDVLIKTCAQQLFDMTDDTRNTSSAYVTHEDISGIPVFQGQTVLVVKAPEETKLEVPTPTEDNIQVHLKAGKGPITVLTCEMSRAGEAAPPTGSGESAAGCFLHMEQSKIKTQPLHTETQQKVVQSA